MVRQVVSATPTVDTNIYASGDCLGSVMTLAGCGEASNKIAMLEHVVVVDKSTSKAAMTVLFFSSLPTIASADNAALDIADAEMAKCVGSVSLVAGDYTGSASSSIGSKVPAAPIALKTGTDGVLYALCVSGGTPTYGSTTDLALRFHFRQD